MIIARFADKFSNAIEKKIKDSLIHTYIKMDTSFGTSKFAISTFFDLNMKVTDDYNVTRYEDPDHFIIRSTNVKNFRVDFLHSR